MDQKKLTKRCVGKEEVALYIGYSRQYVDKLVKKKEIPFFQPGKKVMFDLDEIDKWILRRKFFVSSGKVIAVVQQKGGVGKTTSAVNIAYDIATRGYKTVLMDWDPQASATSNFFPDPLNDNTIYSTLDYFIKKESPDAVLRAVHPTLPTGSQFAHENLFIIPGDDRLHDLRRDLEGSIPQRKALFQLVNRIRQEYQFFVIDTPPSELGIFMVTILTAADYILLVSESSQYSVGAMDRLDNVIKRVRRAKDLDHEAGLMEVLGVIVTKYKNSRTADTYMIDQLKKYYTLIQPYIPEKTQVKDAEITRQPLLKSPFSAEVAGHYNELVSNILQMIEEKSLGESSEAVHD